MATAKHNPGRKQAVDAMKRQLILDAAKRIFAAEGLEGASLRAIAAEAGYTAAALYFHFESKEAIYAELLAQSLASLQARIDKSIAGETEPRRIIRLTATAFYRFYAEAPQDLDLGFYLFRGGMKPKGLGAERNRKLNDALLATLNPVVVSGQALGMPEADAHALAADIFAHISGILLLHLTRRIRIFDVEPDTLFETHMERLLAHLPK